MLFERSIAPSDAVSYVFGRLSGAVSVENGANPMDVRAF
jgi:hypothetical protein